MADDDVMPNFFLDKPLPSNEIAEQTILGAILMDGNFMGPAMEVLEPEDFYSPYHKFIFKVMGRLFSKHVRIDPILLIDEFKAEGQSAESLGGVSRIINLTYGLPRFSTIDDYVKIVKDTSSLRKLIKVCNDITTMCLEEKTEVKEVFQFAEGRVMTLRTDLEEKTMTGERVDFYSLAEIAPEMAQQFDNYKNNISSGVKTGMDKLDQMLDGGGLQEGGLYLVGASEKAGKTSLALQWGMEVAYNQGYEVDVVTTEMAKATLAKRLFSQYTGIPYSVFRPGFYGKFYLKAMKDLIAFSEIPIRIGDRLRTVEVISNRLRRRVENGHRKGQRQVGLGIIDYMQLIELDNATKKNRTDVVAEISRRFKLLATELGIPLVIMSSLNRLGMTEGQRPDTFNLRDSGTLAFDAEAVFFLHNSLYVPGKKYVPQEITDIDLIVSRQRNGPTGDIPLKFIGPYMQFMTESQYAKYSVGEEQAQKPMGQRIIIPSDKTLGDIWTDL